MRKYRGKHIETDEWIYGYLIGNDVIVGDIVEFTDEYFNTEFWYKVDPETVGQLVTGDKYTGDLFAIVCDCDCEFGCSHPTIKCELIWHRQYCQYGYKYGDKFELLDYFGEENVYKIGNRWDNPDLLGEVRG